MKPKIPTLKVFFAAAAILSVCASCSDYDIDGQWWSVQRDDTPPGKITNVSVKSLPGEVVISYTIPADSDFIGVRALYECDSTGIVREKYASHYGASILLDGFVDTQERMVQLFSVDRGGNQSEPILRPVTPLESPVFTVRQSFKVTDTWNGIRVAWSNLAMKEMIVEFYVQDDNGYYILKDTRFSKSITDAVIFETDEEHKDTPTNIRVTIRDHFGVHAPDFIATMNPYSVKELLGWSFLGLNDGTWKYRGDYPPPLGDSLRFLTDKGTTSAEDGTFFRAYTKDYLSDEPATTPYRKMPPTMNLTIDMGKPVYVQKFYMWLQAGEILGSMPWMRQFEVWGSNNPKQVVSGSALLDSWRYWTDWTSITRANGSNYAVNATATWTIDGSWRNLGLLKYELPSGTSSASETLVAIDQQALRNGIPYELDYLIKSTDAKTPPDEVIEPFRYYRIRILSNSGGADESTLAFAEIGIVGNER